LFLYFTTRAPHWKPIGLEGRARGLVSKIRPWQCLRSAYRNDLPWMPLEPCWRMFAWRDGRVTRTRPGEMAHGWGRELRWQGDPIRRIAQSVEQHLSVPRHPINGGENRPPTEMWKVRDEIVEAAGTSSLQHVDHNLLRRRIDERHGVGPPDNVRCAWGPHHAQEMRQVGSREFPSL